MPNWVLQWLLPYVVPIIVQGLTPIIVEYLKKFSELVKGKLPGAAVVALAGVIAEVVNAGQSYVSGAELPPGVGAILVVFLKELGKDFGQEPPTPGVI